MERLTFSDVRGVGWTPMGRAGVLTVLVERAGGRGALQVEIRAPRGLAAYPKSATET
jgi:hypothetical protein